MKSLKVYALQPDVDARGMGGKALQQRKHLKGMAIAGGTALAVGYAEGNGMNLPPTSDRYQTQRVRWAIIGIQRELVRRKAVAKAEKAVEMVEAGLKAGELTVTDSALRDIAPLEITQPEGPGFTVDGRVVRWQRWHSP